MKVNLSDLDSVGHLSKFALYGDFGFCNGDCSCSSSTKYAYRKKYTCQFDDFQVVA